MLRFLTIEGLADGKRDPVVYLMNPPKAKGADVTHSVTSTLRGGCIHVSLNNIHSRTRVHKREGACVNTVPNHVMGNLERTNISGPLVLLSRVSGISDSCGNSASTTLLRILSDRRGYEFESRCVRVPISLSRILFVTATGRISNVPGPLLSEVRLVRISDCARGRGFRVTGRRLIRGRGDGGKVGGRRLAVASSTLGSVVELCAERTKIEDLREAVNGLYHGTTERVFGSDRTAMGIAGAGLGACLNGPGCDPRGGGSRTRIKVIENLT